MNIVRTIVGTKEAKRTTEERQAEINRTNNIRITMLEDKEYTYHIAQLEIKHSASMDMTSQFIELAREYMEQSKYSHLAQIWELEREESKEGIIVKVALKKIYGSVKASCAEYKKSLTYAKRILDLDTANTPRPKGVNENGKDE